MSRPDDICARCGALGHRASRCPWRLFDVLVGVLLVAIFWVCARLGLEMHDA
jgi:hypothetical protein